MAYCDGPRPGSFVRVSLEEFERVTQIDNRMEMLGSGVGNAMGRMKELGELSAERAKIIGDKPVHAPKSQLG